MDTPAIKHEQERTAHAAMEQAPEGQQVWRADIRGVEAKNEPQAVALRRASEGTADREALMPIPAFMDRGLTARGPGAPPGGLQAKAALVEEDEMGLMLLRFFLGVARSVAASEQWPPRPARGPDARVSGASTGGPVKPPDVGRVIPHPKLLADYLPDPGTGPPLGGIPCGPGPRHERGDQPPLLGRGEPRSRSRMGLGLQRALASSLKRLFPPGDRGGSDVEQTGYCTYAFALR
jgi:hypothetical protein